MVRTRAWLVGLLALGAGCNATSVMDTPPDDTGASGDTVAADVPGGGDAGVTSGDGGGMDAPADGAAGDGGVDEDSGAAGDGSSPQDAGVDAGAPDVAPAVCHSDTDCMGIEGARVCDRLSGTCVECVPTADTCPTGFYCTDARRCVAGCRNGSDCVSSDAGMQCDTARHVCVGCLGDGDCMAGTVCTAGACVHGCNATHACPTGQSCCGGACLDTTGSAASCGSCTRVCGTVHAAPTCAMGACQEHCATGWDDCDGDPTNGCETSVVDNAAHCGACGTVCTVPHATATCAGLACAIVSCVGGYQDCDRNPTTGCEANLQTDTANCGGCGAACLPGQMCTAGVCACPAGESICRGACTNTVSDVLNCGGCNIACPAGYGCLGGVCSSDIRTYSTTAAVPASVTFVDVCAMAGATHELAGIDDGMGPTVTLPFPFRFFDGTFTQVTPSADGYLGFGATGTNWGTYGSFTIPSVSFPRPAFYVYSVDLFQRSTGMCFATVGTAPLRSVVWEENDAYRYADTTTHLTWEVYLNEGSNTIDVLYQTISGTGTSGENALVGMQNADATRSTTYEHNVAGTLHSGLRVRFTPNGS